MVRILNAYFPTRTLLLGVSEALVAYFALVGVIYLRFGTDSTLILFYEDGWIRLAIVCLICVICLYYYDLYDSLILTSTREVVTRLVQVIGTTCIILAVLYFLYPSIQLRTTLFVPGVLLMGACLGLWRRLFSLLNRFPGLTEKAVVLGEGPLAVPMAKEIEQRPELGVRLVGYVGRGPDSPTALNGLRRVGGIEDLTEIVESHQVRRVIVTMNDRRGKLPVEKLLELKTRGVVIEDGSAFYETITGKVPLESLRLSQLLFSPGFCVSRHLLVYKRITSLLFSLACLVIASPVMGLVALAIWLDSGRPILFRQKRVGKDGKIFTLYKFRSMKVNGNDHVGNNGKPHPAQVDDERCTRVGRWIRRMRVDELPQLYNIVLGDMYFVGPRPFMLEEEEELALRIPFYNQRWTVRPGATGWAQIHRPYCATLEDNREKLSYDLFYIKNMSIGLDLLIIFQTIKILLLGRGAR